MTLGIALYCIYIVTIIWCKHFAHNPALRDTNIKLDLQLIESRPGLHRLGTSQTGDTFLTLISN